jgi:NADPH:quinone reductase-like Zn-dependent oxidoreductase
MKGLLECAHILLRSPPPGKGILGMDFAGVVAAVDANVTSFQPGDAVPAMLGASFGGHAEYARVLL